LKIWFSIITYNYLFEDKFNTKKLIGIFFYFHHTDRNHSIKSHIVTLTDIEKRMLLYVLDLFDRDIICWKQVTANTI
jgi:hypothetical protein